MVSSLSFSIHLCPVPRRAWQPTPVFLPRESPWTEEPGGIQSIVSQKVGHDWSFLAQASYSIYDTLILKTMFFIWNSNLTGYPALSGFPGGSAVNNLPVNAGDAEDSDSIPGLRRSSGEGNGNPLQYSCLVFVFLPVFLSMENPMDRGAWWATVHRVRKSQT